MDILISMFTQSMLFFPLVLGIYISYGILKTTDMTVDGSFVLGAAVFARMVTLNVSPVISFIVAILAGTAAGIMVSAIQAKGKINSLIAGILALFILYSFNFMVMGRPNISLLNQPTIFQLGSNSTMSWVIVGLFVALLTILLGLFILSRFGMVLRAFGDNPFLLQKLGKSTEGYRFLGLALSNSLVALCGALTAQVHGYADVTMGFGMTLTGIGAVVIGKHLIETIPRKNNFSIGHDLSGCFLGTSLYFLAINLFLFFGINALHVKMLLGIVLVFLLRTTTQSMRT